MTIEQHKDVESGEANVLGSLQEPFIQHGEAAATACEEVGSEKSVENGSIGMVLLSTLVAVCGSFSFGTCVSILKLSENYNWQSQDAVETMKHKIRKERKKNACAFSYFGF